MRLAVKDLIDIKGVVTTAGSAKEIRIGRLYLSGTDPKIDKAIDDALVRAQFQVIPLDQAFKEKWNQAEKDGITLAAAGAWISDRKYFDKLVGERPDHSVTSLQLLGPKLSEAGLLNAGRLVEATGS